MTEVCIKDFETNQDMYFDMEELTTENNHTAAKYLRLEL